jgi:hypothetical protein
MHPPVSVETAKYPVTTICVTVFGSNYSAVQQTVMEMQVSGCDDEQETLALIYCADFLLCRFLKRSFPAKHYISSPAASVRGSERVESLNRVL